ncbi:HpcH/HpaI aldolase/citrate lyase family protein [Hydrogenophaga sp.]|uniref:HpcH/HpaI aldolase/citrate lyase family protein n=1 Tax=Hydrogenophaga sp. TaxID=1904254 RepID=UPI0025BDFF83|nr:HpcH/HpaI aldolase/citrate lyase family protein [Hydrogenophaga sp.]MBT9463706.1 HpcH/HpaI aldolase/citrate lyase family protein [Hydrogenophaga sp.]
MQTPTNAFKQALAARRVQIGLWLGLANPYSAEICAGADFDWLLIDGEHSPNSLKDLLAQAQAIAAYPGSHAIARVPVGDAALIKQYLDIGLQTLLVPMVDTPEQAAQLVRACRYPQADDVSGQGGVRGMAGARASRWGRYPNYAKEANAQVCLLVQAETREALAQLDAIAATPGVDGVFIGPADLSASLGHVGNPGHPEVQAAIEHAIRGILRAGKAPGILTADEAQARHYLALGAVFVAVGLDTQILARQTSALAARFKADAPAMPAPTKGSVY